MRKLAFSTVLVLAIALASCGQAQQSTEATTFNGPFFSVAKPFGEEPVLEGRKHVFNSERMAIFIDGMEMPGNALGQLDTAESFIKAESEMYGSPEITQTEVNGLKGFSLVATANGKRIMGWTASINDGLVSIRTNEFDSADAKLASAYESMLESFVVTNPDYFKGRSGSAPEVQTPEASPDDLPGAGKPATFENANIKVGIPKGWEATALSPERIELAPDLENTTDANFGITVDIIAHHGKQSDLAFAQTQMPGAAMRKHGKNDFASFSVAQTGIHVFIASKGSKTFMITLSTPTEEIPPKLGEFLGTVELR